MVSKTLPLGAWESDRPTIEATRIGDRGDVSDLSRIVQFRVHVARLIKRRELNSTAEYDRAAAFVLVSNEQFESFKQGRQLERLIHTGARRLTGRIHFVNASATSSVVEELVGDDSAMFSRLLALNVDELPSLVYVPQKPRSSLSFYPKGTSTDTEVVEDPIDPPLVTADAVGAAIGQVHAEVLVSPDGTGPLKIWENASQGRPVKLAEQSIQQLVRSGLAVGFAPYSIRQEQPSKVGRTDLEIVDERTGAPGHVIHHAVLELKVLRSRGETGVAVNDATTEAHIADGVDQAYAYGRNKNTLLQMLCCFDMRDTDIRDAPTFAHVTTKAETLSVKLRRWYLYRSSKDYRAAMSGAATATTGASTSASK